MAAWYGKSEMVRFLVQKGASVNARDFEGLTPLDLALAEPFEETAELLRSLGGKKGEEIQQ